MAALTGDRPTCTAAYLGFGKGRAMARAQSASL